MSGWEDTKTGRRYAEYVPRLLKEWLDRRILLRGEPYLDVGCYQGLFVIENASKGLFSVGLDIQKNRLMEAMQKAKLFRLEHLVSFVMGHAEHLPFKSLCFETVTCLEVLEHLIYPEVAFSELVRVSRSVAVISTPTTHCVPWYRAYRRIRSLLAGKGWTFSPTEELPRDECRYLPHIHALSHSDLLQMMAQNRVSLDRIVAVHPVLLPVSHRVLDSIARSKLGWIFLMTVDMGLGKLSIFKGIGDVTVLSCRKKVFRAQSELLFTHTGSYLKS